MKLVPFIESRKVRVGNDAMGAIAREYDTGNPDLNVALVDVVGRYPVSGRKVNLACDMVVIVIGGKGRVVVNGIPYKLSKLDVVEINKGEKYYWEGNMQLVPACHPSWTPEQNVSVD